MKTLSHIAQNITPSATLSISSRAKELKASGADIINLSIGEPDFNTPENIREAAITRINHGNNGYTAVAGIAELKKAICKKLKDDNQLEYKPEQIVVSNGAKQSLYNTCMAILNAGDEVILPTPSWVSYIEMVKLAGAKPIEVLAEAKNDFIPTMEELEAVVTPKTKAIIINSPNNPTGAVFDKETLIKIGNFAKKYDLYIISDEIYEKIIYGAEHYSIAALHPDFYERTITINGLSKAYSMTGWRIGYTASNLQIAKLMSNIQSHSTSAPNTVAQYAAVEGLVGNQASVESMRNEFERRRDFVIQELQNFEKIRYILPKGAFYVFLDISNYIGTTIAGVSVNNTNDFAQVLLEKGNIAVVPGEAFGIQNYIRVSYATSMENLQKTFQNLKNLNL